MAKICASYGKPRLEGFEEQPNLEMISFSNVIHCKHCRVEEVLREYVHKFPLQERR